MSPEAFVLDVDGVLIFGHGSHKREAEATIYNSKYDTSSTKEEG